MRPATFWDLMTSTHILTVLILTFAFLAQIFAIRWAKKKMKSKLAVVFSLSILITFFIGMIVRASLPGGGLYDTDYDADRMGIRLTQERLLKYKKECGFFPTTDQGLAELTKPSKRCVKFQPMFDSVEPYKYESDGTTYVIENYESYRIRGLFVRGTDKDLSALYIREE